ncbi:MAG TPA: small multi-drug export protein [Candidatus Paceibacterota bacterium]|nr:small multi-drug export protein [Candidatus Paceibacterota bacterium]
MSPEFTTVAFAALPIFELRGAIPLAVFAYGMPALKAYLLGVLGSSLPVLPLLFFLNFVYMKAVHRFYWPNRFFTWLFERTRAKHAGHFMVWKDLALMVFVAVPLPMTGAWSGTIAAFVFGIPMRQAAAMIIIGNAISGFIVLLLSKAISLV